MAAFRSSIALLCAALAMMFAQIPWCPAAAYTFRTVYDFCAQGGDVCPDGGDPRGKLFRDQSGNLYGVTSGSAKGGGTIFELVPTSHGAWKHKLLYSFCSRGVCSDGEAPDSGLIADTSGDFYGTTSQGGKYGQGIVYELTPNAARKRWRLKVLHDFCPGGDPDCEDGAFIVAPLTYEGATSGALYDGVSPLYGAAAFGGTFGWGTVFRIQPVSGKKTWSLKTLYNFCAQLNCADGASPTAGLTVDASGNLLGTTQSGQNSGNNGVVFELVPNAKKTKWSETVLHSFCSVGNCLDGAIPSSGLVMDASGNLFGAASGGGSGNAICFGSIGCGVVYKIVPNGAASQETVLYNFCALSNCADGLGPFGNVVFDPAGNLLGATAFGGVGGETSGGTLFELDAAHGGTYGIAHVFCSEPSCADGAQPLGDLIMDGSGEIFGVTETGGATNAGTVFELTP